MIHMIQQHETKQKNHVLMLYFLHTVLCQDVTQHPAVSWSYASKSALINCSHTKDIRHTLMY